MPTYQYACTACEHRFEAVQSFSDASLTECPQCEGRLRKVFSNVGIVFKGSGFYRTDSRAAAASGDAPAKETKEKAGAGAAKEGSSGDSGSSASSSTSGSSSSDSSSSGSTASSSTNGSTSSTSTSSASSAA